MADSVLAQVPQHRRVLIADTVHTDGVPLLHLREGLRLGDDRDGPGFRRYGITMRVQRGVVEILIDFLYHLV